MGDAEKKSIPVHEDAPDAAFLKNFDYVMVFKVESIGIDQSDVCKHCFYEMLAADLDLYPYLSVQKDELIILISCSREKLRAFANKIDFKLELNRDALMSVMTTGNLAKDIMPVNIENNDEKYGKLLDPYSHIFGKYHPNYECMILPVPGKGMDSYIYGEDACKPYPAEFARVNLYKPNDPSEPDAFTKVVRLKLIFLMLEGSKLNGGAGLLLSKYIASNAVEAFYALHDTDIAEDLLQRCWSWSVMPWKFPFKYIRLYFGERFTQYFQFVGHYCWYLLPPAIVGLAFQIVVWRYVDFSYPVLPFFGVLISLWTMVLLENWKRRENTIALQQGMTDFEENEPDRPEFRGELIPSFINGKKMRYFNNASRKRRIMLSGSVIGTLILLIIGVVAGIYVLRFSLQKRANTEPYSSTVASVLNAIQIQVFNILYGYFASRMTTYENHRTDTEFQDSIISKTFFFQFVNSYSSFFFLAFIAGNMAPPDPINANDDRISTYQGQCGDVNCMQPLSINLAIIFGTRLVVNNFLSVVVPYIQYRMKLKSETKDVDASLLTGAEKDYMLQEYHVGNTDLANFADVVMEYGYMIMFVVALPISCLLSMINSYAKVKFAIWRHLKLFQRPIPKGVQDIGTWQSIFTIISVVAVVTNGALICFTMDVLNGFTLAGKLWIFIGFMWVMMSTQAIFTIVIPDEPTRVSVQKQRQAFFVSKAIDLLPDEMEETNDFDMDTDHHSKTSHLHLKYENASGVPIDRKYPLESHATASALAEVIHGLQGRMTLWPNDDNTDMKKKYAALREKQSTSTSVPAAPKPKTAVPPQDSADIVLRVGNDSDDEAGFIQAK